MQVKQIAGSLGITAETVRYYTRIGLVTPFKNSLNGYKDYSEADIQRLRFIVNARHLGFSIEDIAAIIQEADKGLSPCPMVRSLIKTRLEELDRRFLEMQALRDSMQKALKDWQAEPDKAPTGAMVCHLINSCS
jgi:DNA-binding transcriptional MerR regulator